MTFDRDDAALLFILLWFLGWAAYSNYAFVARVDEKLNEVREYNYNLLLRQAHISMKQDSIMNAIDSLYLRNK